MRFEVYTDSCAESEANGKLRVSFHRSTCCVIQGMYSETLVYTPGSRGRAQPTPDETTPTTIMLPSA